MPLPTPNKNESEPDFIARCVQDEVVKNDFADQKQRVAVCYSQWRASAGIGYCVKAQALERDGKKYAVIEIIDENTSRPCEEPPDTPVRINPAGKTRALASLREKPLLGPPEAGHEATQVVGRAVDFISNHATRVLYEIPNENAWNEIQAGRWGPVSPKMTPLAAHYEDGVYVLDEWVWDNVAFVPQGAFPNAGVKSTCIGDPRLCGFTAQTPCGFHYAVAAALSSQSRLKAQRPRTETNVGAYSPERASKGPEEKQDEKTKEVSCLDKCEHEKVIAQLTEKNATLETEANDLKGKVAEQVKAMEKLETELKD